MGDPNSEVGYTSAMPRREDHEVRKEHVGDWIKKNFAKLAQYLSCVFLLLSWHCAVHNYKYVYIFWDYESSGLIRRP